MTDDQKTALDSILQNHSYDRTHIIAILQHRYFLREFLAEPQGEICNPDLRRYGLPRKKIDSDPNRDPQTAPSLRNKTHD